MNPSTPADRADCAALPPGTRLQDYRIAHVLGCGGFGITYLAHDVQLDRPVAIKEYFPGELLTGSPGGQRLLRVPDPQALERFEHGLQRFIDEARALAALRHPHIVRVLRHFRAQGTAYIVMEYESGQSLTQWLPTCTPLTLSGLLAIILPLLDGLDTVHAAGFLHRDIKPDNIYLRADGSPVLLDFGASRRLHTHEERSNIVSPGFAPLEQYHSQGDQGPWTDLYSLGAVMYWLVTGRKPPEAAARVHADSMTAAAEAGDRSVFGRQVLRAIDWALHPDARRRPRNVSQLRAALSGDAVDATSPGLQARASGPALPHFTNPGPRNLLCTILFLDLVGYSARTLDDQALMKTRFNDVVTRAIQDVAADSRLTIDTGDGAAVCFLADPEEALRSAMLLRDLIAHRYGGALPVRIGLHMGPVRVVPDINERINVVGDGINVAQRIMDCARTGQILVSRSYYDVISRIADTAAELFRPAGVHRDKHGRFHELHTVHDKAYRACEPQAAYARTPPLAADMRSVDPHTLRQIETDLAHYIGPLAPLLVAQALTDCSDTRTLLDRLATHVEPPAQRESFLQAIGRWLPPDPIPLDVTPPSNRPRP